MEKKAISNEVSDIINDAKTEIINELNKAKQLSDLKNDDKRIISIITNLYGIALQAFITAKAKIVERWNDVNTQREYAWHLGYDELLKQAETLLRKRIEILSQIDVVNEKYKRELENLEETTKKSIEDLEEQFSDNADLKLRHVRKEDLAKKVQQIIDFDNPGGVRRYQ
ncbi:MAG: hypothetical protein LBC87_07010 [Fibromonadaceae bacterium]|jgi:hypothetical protein|nr:hypothetical protein [Fibromonadaceae bacterium]